MRRRIVLATVAVLATAIVAFSIPLAVAVRGLLVSRALDELQAQTEQVAIIIDDQARTCAHVDLFLALASQERAAAALSLFNRGGQLLATVPGHDPTRGVELERAATGAAGRRLGSGSLAVAVPLSTDVCLQRLVLHAEQPDGGVTASIRGAWLSLAAVAVLVLALAGGVALLVADRVARPLRDLAESAARLGQGDFSVRVPRSGMPEVDRIADTLDHTADRLGRAVDRGRTFAADASHQLRTPMTALRLQLEGLQARGVAPEEVDAALAEADRLEATVAELVALTSLDTAEEELVATELVAPPVDTTRAAAQQQHRDLALDVVADPAVRTRPAAIRQALQVLLDNALEHGRGTISVTVGPPLPSHPERGVRIAVADEGPGPGADALVSLRARDRGIAPPGSRGRGLRLARVLVEGEGGRLVAEETDGRIRMCIVLPRRQNPESVVS